MIGIYKITNTVNGKVYIGQSWCINKRWRDHTCYECNTHLKSAFEKYGIDKFSFEVIKELHDTPLTQILLDVYEKKHIVEFDSRNPTKGYNNREGGSRGKQSEESKAKMRITKNSPEYRAKASASHLGIKRSAESKAKQSVTMKGRPNPNKGIRRPEEVIAKIRATKSCPESKAKSKASRIGKKHPHKGAPASQQKRAKLSVSHTGTKRSAEANAKQSATMKGRPSPLKGRKQSIYHIYKGIFTKLGWKAEFS